jgi:hypothetical protein
MCVKWKLSFLKTENPKWKLALSSKLDTHFLCFLKICIGRMHSLGRSIQTGM